MARRTAVVAAAAVGVALLGSVVAFNVRPDPSEQVQPVTVDQVSLAPSTGTNRPDDPDPTASPAADPSDDAPTSGSQQVEALDPLNGTLVAEDDPGEYRLGTVDLDFGPDAWVLTAPPLQDFNRDGRTERLEVELDSLVGQPVTLLVRLDDGNDASVYVLNEQPYRDPAGPGPWVTGPAAAAATAAPVAAVRQAAAAAVGVGARVDELEPIQAGQVAWEASVTREDGQEFVVLLDTAGAVLTARED